MSYRRSTSAAELTMSAGGLLGCEREVDDGLEEEIAG